jgi:hypothetical protein
LLWSFGIPFATSVAAVQIAFTSLPNGVLSFAKGNRIMMPDEDKREGRISYGIAAMILGLPLPFVILAFLCGGCDRW